MLELANEGPVQAQNAAHERSSPAATVSSTDVASAAGRRAGADADGYARLTVKQLQTLLREQGLRVSGRKAELIERLESAAISISKPEDAVVRGGRAPSASSSPSSATLTHPTSLRPPKRRRPPPRPRTRPPEACASSKRRASAAAPLSGVPTRRVEVDLLQAAPVSNPFVLEVDDRRWWQQQSFADESDQWTTRSEAAAGRTKGGQLWPASVAIAQYLAALPSGALEGARVLELGCGNGLCSLTAAALGAHTVLATDVSTEALALTARAAREQHLTLETSTFDLSDRRLVLPAADLVVAADLLYEHDLAVAVASRIAEAAARGSWVVVGDQRRSGRDAFLRSLRKRTPEGTHYAFDELADEVSVQLPALGWKAKRVGMMRINEPRHALTLERRK